MFAEKLNSECQDFLASTINGWIFDSEVTDFHVGKDQKKFFSFKRSEDFRTSDIYQVLKKNIEIAFCDLEWNKIDYPTLVYQGIFHHFLILSDGGERFVKRIPKSLSQNFVEVAKEGGFFISMKNESGKQLGFEGRVVPIGATT